MNDPSGTCARFEPSSHTYVAATKRVGWDSTAGHLSSVVQGDGCWGSLAFSEARMMVSYPSRARERGSVAGPLHNALFGVGGVLTNFLAGAIVDDMMKIGDYKTESITKCKIRATSTAPWGALSGIERRDIRVPGSCNGRLLKNIFQLLREEAPAIRKDRKKRWFLTNVILGEPACRGTCQLKMQFNDGTNYGQNQVRCSRYHPTQDVH